MSDPPPVYVLDTNVFVQAHRRHWLVAYAKSNGQHVVVTHEELSPDAKRRVPLPNVCKQFSVDYTDPFAMLKDLKARFTWTAKGAG